MSKTSKQAGERTQKEELRQFDEGVKLAGRNRRVAILIEGDKVIFCGQPADLPVRFISPDEESTVETTMQNVVQSGTPIDDLGDDYETVEEIVVGSKKLSLLIESSPRMLETLKYVQQCCAGHDEWFLGEFSNEVASAILSIETTLRHKRRRADLERRRTVADLRKAVQ